MNWYWLSVLSVFVLNIRSEKDLIKIQKAFFLENNFWCNNTQDKLKTDKGYLSKVNIDIELKNGFRDGFDCLSNTNYILKSTNFGYVVLKYTIIKENIASFLKSPEDDKFLLRLCFFFSKPIKESFYNKENNNFKTTEYLTYKLPEKISKFKNVIDLRNDKSIDIHTKHIKTMFTGFIWMKILKFNEYIKILNAKKKKIENDADFDLYHFKNYSECCKSLKNFIEDLRYLKLIKKGASKSFISKFSKISVGNPTFLRIPQFRRRFCKKFYENLKKMKDIKIDKVLKPLFNQCYIYIKDEMLKNNIFFPIGGKYDIDFYIIHLSNLIYESIKKLQKDYARAYSKDKDFIFSRIVYSLKNGLDNIQLTIMKDLCESEYIPKHFSKLLGKKFRTLDDYIEIEKMVCDYYNMFVYIVDLYYRLNDVLFVPNSYFPPISNDDYNLRIIDGLKINFNWLVDFGYIRGFDDKGEEVIMVKDTDYFIDELDIVYCPSNILKMKNIYEIEVNSSDNKNKKKFKISEYLSL